jgi:heme-degrading monooxygenase HmoA
MGALYASGDWMVKPGREDDFVAAWRDLAEWSMENLAGGAWAKLLRDREDPRRFVSLGPWDSLEAAVEVERAG